LPENSVRSAEKIACRKIGSSAEKKSCRKIGSFDGKNRAEKSVRPRKKLRAEKSVRPRKSCVQKNRFIGGKICVQKNRAKNSVRSRKKSCKKFGSFGGKNRAEKSVRPRKNKNLDLKLQNGYPLRNFFSGEIHDYKTNDSQQYVHKFASGGLCKGNAEPD
jgi:hypothetical protein